MTKNLFLPLNTNDAVTGEPKGGHVGNFEKKNLFKEYEHT